jgi:hypothetical protein
LRAGKADRSVDPRLRGTAVASVGLGGLSLLLSFVPSVAPPLAVTSSVGLFLALWSYGRHRARYVLLGALLNTLMLAVGVAAIVTE